MYFETFFKVFKLSIYIFFFYIKFNQKREWVHFYVHLVLQILFYFSHVHKYQNDLQQTASTDENGEYWRDHLQRDCRELLNKVSWAQTILKNIPTFNRKSDDSQDLFLLTQLYKANSSSQQMTQNQSSLSSKRLSAKQLKKYLIRSDLVGSFDDRSHNQHQSSSSIASLAYQDKLVVQKQFELEPTSWSLALKQIDFFVKLTQTLEKSIINNNLSRLINMFDSCFIDSFGKCGEQQLFRCIFELQQFSRVFQQCIINYFELQKLKKYTQSIGVLISDDSLMNLSVSLCIRNVYQILYENALMMLDLQVQQTKRIMYQNSQITCGQCGISVQYCLDNCTIIQYKENHQNELTGSSQNSYNRYNNENNKQPPYMQAIRQIRKIVQKQSPISKMKAIIQTSYKIIKCINQFYRRNDLQFDGVISSEDIIPILTYILIRSQIYEIDVHLYLIEKLSSNQMLASSSGYYLYSLQGACMTMPQIQQQR